MAQPIGEWTNRCRESAADDRRLETRFALFMLFLRSFALSVRSKIAIGVLSVLGMPFALPILLWAILWSVNFIDLFMQEKCSFGSISDVEYQTIVSRAGAQRWTVWPGLSNGVFLPSEGSDIGDQLVSHIGELAGSDPSSNRQLASAHAILRTIGAEYVQTQEVPDMHRRGVSSRVRFTYYLPRVRFAPVCYLCLVRWYTTIDVLFSHELATDRYEFAGLNVLHAGLKYDPGNKERVRNVPSGSCPALRR
ncbi:hypothetical protein CQ13_36930 [Bradyrhizobium retamae]|uniref:Uncharacterized protein n=1 Tax=Bradyrhizobium retamae TaxID=1300035 RepID=A0A0R3M8Y2_9BRAD|nr:hypothetical protein CQ13_36930 [Bradyrhizobium retamae]